MRFLKKPYEPTIFSDVVNPQVEFIWEEFRKSFI
jgi:hypothetical protein